MRTATPTDLVVLVADLDAELTLKALLARPAALGCSPFGYRIMRHPGRDSSCAQQPLQILGPLATTYEHVLLLFDHHGSGRETIDVVALERQLEAVLSVAGWPHRAGVVVIQPELENWVWSDSPHVDTALGWANRDPGLRDWLRAQGWLHDDSPKPTYPKQALVSALRHVGQRSSADLFTVLARRVSVNRCTDRAFLKLKRLLQSWFPA